MLPPAPAVAGGTVSYSRATAAQPGDTARSSQPGFNLKFKLARPLLALPRCAAPAAAIDFSQSERYLFSMRGAAVPKNCGAMIIMEFKHFKN